jgi:hypothetical protein
MTYVPAPMRRLVRERAQQRCEYCLLPDTIGFFPHEIDHVVAEKHEGQRLKSSLSLMLHTAIMARAPRMLGALRHTSEAAGAAGHWLDAPSSSCRWHPGPARQPLRR